MHEPTYRQALSHAWKLAWHHKLTWIVGLLSVFLGQLGLSNFLGQLMAKMLTDENWWPAAWGVIRITSNEGLFWFVWTLLIILGMVLFVLVAAVCAQGALLIMAVHWYRYHTVPTLSQAWKDGIKHFWGVLGINFLEKFTLSVLLFVVGGLVGLFPNSTAGLFWQIVVVSIGIFLALVVSTIAIFALGYTVLDKVPVVEAVGKAYKLFSRHLVVSFELAVILLVCNLAVFAVISFVSVLSLMPSFVLSLIAGATGYVKLLTVSVALYMFLMLFLTIMIGAAFNTFTTGAWMYLFMKMDSEGIQSRLHHLWKKIRHHS